MGSWLSNLVSWPHPSVDRLTAFKDGELTPDAAQLVASHLERCPACRGHVERQEEVEELFRQTTPSLGDDELDRELARARSALERSATGSAILEQSPFSPACPRELVERLFGIRVAERLRRFDSKARLDSPVTCERLVFAFLGMKMGTGPLS
ncbi:MAG: zf-HC2 domain-containing protein [Acidobacteria bacterium]|nr:zf-HC2 domain-containing protein [Acidobacteriota bacterium]